MGIRWRSSPNVLSVHQRDRRGFADETAVLVPTECARRLYARRLGLECVHIPLPLNPARILATDPEPRYVTFVNPQVPKGAAVVARIVEVVRPAEKARTQARA